MGQLIQRVTAGDATPCFSPCARVNEEKAELLSPAVTFTDRATDLKAKKC